jgi:hypothetical protein
MESFGLILILSSYVEKIQKTDNEKLPLHLCKLIGNIINYEEKKINKTDLNKILNDKLTDELIKIMGIPSENSENEIEKNKIIDIPKENSENKIEKNKIIDIPKENSENKIIDVPKENSENKIIDVPKENSENKKDEIEKNKIMRLYFISYLFKGNNYDGGIAWQVDFKGDFERFMEKYNSDV